MPSVAQGEPVTTERFEPEWVHQLEMGVWITSPEGRLTFVNERAQALLCSSEDELLGTFCHVSIGGRRVDGAPLCTQCCPFREAAARHEPLEPVTFRLDGPDGPRWALVVSMGLEAPDGTHPWLLHIAIEADRAHRLQTYLERVAHRTDAGPRPEVVLSTREREVLDCLSRDMSLHAIAGELNVSYATVRNHVQRILRKLDAHSIMEAVARHLLGEG